MEERDFGWALKRLREGLRVQRSGWNGKGMWIVLVNKWAVLHGDDSAEHLRAIPANEESFWPFIGMKTADDKFVPWLASQTDVLATDWGVVE